MGLLCQVAVPFLINLGKSTVFTIVVAPVCIPTYSIQYKGSFFFTSLLALVVCWFIDGSHSGRCDVVPHCHFNCISLMMSDIEHFFKSHLFTCPLWNSVSSGLLPIFKLHCLSFYCWAVWVLYIFWRLNPCQMYHWQICSPCSSFPFHFDAGTLCCTEGF